MTKMRHVYISEGSQEYINLFTSRKGWVVTTDLKKADLVQFTGGADVSPSLYGCAMHPKTYPNAARDEREVRTFNIAKEAGIPMAGICRGGQFLNVMCGGKMYQDVEGHAMGRQHMMLDLFCGDEFQVTSTHHQMMKPAPDASIIGVSKICNRREYVDKSGDIHVITRDDMDDYEILFYQKNMCFCFQPHPEFYGQRELGDRYIDYILTYLIG